MVDIAAFAKTCPPVSTGVFVGVHGGHTITVHGTISLSPAEAGVPAHVWRSLAGLLVVLPHHVLVPIGAFIWDGALTSCRVLTGLLVLCCRLHALLRCIHVAQDTVINWWETAEDQYRAAGLGDPTNSDKYIASLCTCALTAKAAPFCVAASHAFLPVCRPDFAFSTITTVGYGDIVPVSYCEPQHWWLVSQCEVNHHLTVYLGVTAEEQRGTSICHRCSHGWCHSVWLHHWERHSAGGTAE